MSTTKHIGIAVAAKTLSRIARAREPVILTNRGFDVAIVLPMPADAAHREYQIVFDDDGCETWSIVPAPPTGAASG